tara:strand:+ start:141 stop:677 length:537 start_codon:yes stop_codon:yes gene_type:complete
MATLDEDFYKIGTSFRRPIPGESLTRSPEDRYAWEQPPAITDPREASRFFLTKLTEPEVYNSVLDSVEQGTPLMDIAQVLMYQAFVDGIINPDLMMTMVEQIVYMIAALAERQGIDFIIQEDDEEDIREEQDLELLANNVPEEITEQVEETALPERTSLLDNTQQPTPEQPSSLLGAT